MRREVLESPGAYRLGVRKHIAKNVVAAEHLRTLLELLRPGREFSRQEADAIIPEPVDEWVARLDGGPTEVRRDAATVLGEMEEYAVDSTSALLALLRDDAPAVRKAALAALDKIGWQHAPTTGRVERLIPFLTEGDWVPVTQAIRGLKSLGKEATKALPHLRKLRDTSTNRYVIDDVNTCLQKVDGIG